MLVQERHRIPAFSRQVIDRSRIAVGNIVRIASRRLEESEIDRDRDLATRPDSRIFVPICAGIYRRNATRCLVAINMIL
jgi:hypothetical protein